MGSRKSISMQARQQYHQGAYQTYIERVANETKSIDNKVMPFMTNEKGKVLSNFAKNYADVLKTMYGTEELDEEKILAVITELKGIEEAKKAGRTEETREFTPQENGLLIMSSLDICQKEKGQVEPLPLDKLEELVKVAVERVDAIDLKSYTNWNEDPDCNYQVKV